MGNALLAFANTVQFGVAVGAFLVPAWVGLSIKDATGEVAATLGHGIFYGWNEISGDTPEDESEALADTLYPVEFDGLWRFLQLVAGVVLFMTMVMPCLGCMEMFAIMRIFGILTFVGASATLVLYPVTADYKNAVDICENLGCDKGLVDWEYQTNVTIADVTVVHAFYWSYWCAFGLALLSLSMVLCVGNRH